MKRVKRLLIFTLIFVLSISFNSYNTNAERIGKASEITDFLKNKKQPKVDTLDPVTNLKVYRSTEAALVSWDKVDNANYYLVYRKNGKSGKYQKIGKVSENDFVLSTNKLKVREFVDIRYKESKKKSSMNYKGRKYLYDKNYTYKVIAVNRKVKSRGVTYYSKKWKMKKNELSYYTLYYVNKIRKKNHLPFYIWGHAYEKGSLETSKWLSKKENHNPKLKHTFQFYKYMEGNVRNGITGETHAFCTGGDGNAVPYSVCKKWHVTKREKKDHRQYHAGFSGLVNQNVGMGYEGAGVKDILDSYYRSDGHYANYVWRNWNKYEYSSILKGTSKKITLEYFGLKFTYQKNELDITQYSLTSSTYSKNILKDHNVYNEIIIAQEDDVIDEYKYR